MRTEKYIGVVSASVNDDRQLLIRRRSKNFAEGFRCEAFQNTASASIETERPTAMQSFW